LVVDYFKDIVFKYPAVFYLLAILPLLVWRHFAGRQKNRQGIGVSSTKGLMGLGGSKATLQGLPFWLRLFSLAFLIVALARPQLVSKEQLSEGEGIDIVLCMDVSGSMLAEDFSPNRLEAAKEVASNFIDSRVSDRVAIVMFSGESFTLCPLTTDKNMLKSQVYNMKQGLLEDGTAIGSGLATSCDRLKDSKTKTKIVILLTDGENNGGLIDPQTAKEIAKSFSIRVYTIGVGTDKGEVVMPTMTPMGTVKQRQKVSIDEKLLTQIAKETGGKYYRAIDNTSLVNIYADIEKLEKSKVQVIGFDRYTERFLPFIAMSFLLLVIELLLKYTLLKKFP
jgi:Ca-activated chloride channel homolog